jgi:hypothetical protein
MLCISALSALFKKEEMQMRVKKNPAKFNEGRRGKIVSRIFVLQNDIIKNKSLYV